MLYRRIYISAASAGLGASEVNRLLEVSRRNNEAVHLTGLLILHQGRFFQTLEGKKADVIACYNRILQDKRHSNITLINQGDAPFRAFDNWRMGFATPENLSPELKQSVFSLYDLVPPNSEDRGSEDRVRREVRNFLAGFQRFASSSAAGTAGA